MRITAIAALIFLAAAGQAQVLPQSQEENSIKFLYAVNGYFTGSKFANPAGIAIDEGRNLVYVSDTDGNVVDAFSTQGIPRFQIGVNKELKAPQALAVDRDGNLYVAERGKSKIKVFNTDNEMAEVIDVAGICEGAGAVARMKVGRDRSLYIIDQENQQVIVLDQNRKLRLKFGKPGADRGQFKTIEDIAVDRQGRMYVTDSSGIPVQAFDSKGKFIYKFGQRGAADDDFVQPTSIAVDRFDQVWVADTSEHTIRIFDRVGFFIKTFGEYGMSEGTLYYPIDLGIDGFGKVYVLERGLRRLQVFALDKPFQPFRRQ
jgi:sugar lactone lactonase YvrE